MRESGYCGLLSTLRGEVFSPYPMGSAADCDFISPSIGVSIKSYSSDCCMNACCVYYCGQPPKISVFGCWLGWRGFTSLPLKLGLEAITRSSGVNPPDFGVRARWKPVLLSFLRKKSGWPSLLRFAAMLRGELNWRTRGMCGR